MTKKVVRLVSAILARRTQAAPAGSRAGGSEATSRITRPNAALRRSESVALATRLTGGRTQSSRRRSTPMPAAPRGSSAPGPSTRATNRPNTVSLAASCSASAVRPPRAPRSSVIRPSGKPPPRISSNAGKPVAKTAARRAFSSWGRTNVPGGASSRKGALRAIARGYTPV
jgi:hypothetical protein